MSSDSDPVRLRPVQESDLQILESIDTDPALSEPFEWRGYVRGQWRDGFMYARLRDELPPPRPARGAAAVMRAMVAMFGTGDLSELEAVVHADYLDHQGLGEGAIRGPEGFATVVGAARSDYDVLNVAVEDLIEGRDRAVARLSWRGTQKSGDSVDRETIDIVRIQDGRAVEHWGGHSGIGGEGTAR